jgi:hypothetical protein
MNRLIRIAELGRQADSTSRRAKVRALAWVAGVLSACVPSLVLSDVGVAWNSASSENSVVQFLDGAERQTETDQQRRVVRRALTDMLRLPPKSLQKRRYPDYEGYAGVWSIREVLRHYFVPRRPSSLQGENFDSEYLAAEGQAVIRRQLAGVEKALENAP